MVSFKTFIGKQYYFIKWKLMGDDIAKWQAYFLSKDCGYFIEYPESYGWIDFAGKRVINVGSDCLSACVYALLHGAVYCIGYESNPELRFKASQVIKELHLEGRVEMRELWNGQYDDADVFLMDCESCESNVDLDLVIKKYPTWCIAVHSWTKDRMKLLKKLQGYTFRYITPDGYEIMICSKA